MLSPRTLFNSSAWNHHALLTCAEMRRAEEIACGRGTASFDLMQRAGDAIAAIIRERWKPCRVLVLCGPGNNGGDGYVIAENLRRVGWDVVVACVPRPLRGRLGGGFSPQEQDSVLVAPTPPLTPPARGGERQRQSAGQTSNEGDAARAAKNWQGKTLVLDDVSFDAADLVVDALFGAGLTRPLGGAARTMIEKLAAAKVPVVAVDLPSGINGDTGAIMGAAIQAALTVTFFRKKPGHISLPGRMHCGETVIADIGIGAEVLDEIKPLTAENTADLWIERFPFPKTDAHKYTRGHALIAGGAVMTGATRLAARAAQRMGAGLVTLAAPQSAVPIYAEALESVIVRPADTLAAWKDLLADAKRNAILIGPGLGLGAAQAEFVLAALDTRKACVLDADALTNFANNPKGLFAKLHPDCVLTPHEGEFARLFGSRIDPQDDKLSRARKAAEIAGCVVLLKGADTVIADHSGCAIVNDNAPPSLAVAGAGDVLAGMILGLIAQSMPPFAATAAAAWMHGQAATQFGPGLIAEDLIDGIPGVLRGLLDMGRSV